MNIEDTTIRMIPPLVLGQDFRPTTNAGDIRLFDSSTLAFDQLVRPDDGFLISWLTAGELLPNTEMYFIENAGNCPNCGEDGDLEDKTYENMAPYQGELAAWLDDCRDSPAIKMLNRRIVESRGITSVRLNNQLMYCPYCGLLGRDWVLIIGNNVTTWGMARTQETADQYQQLRAKLTMRSPAWASFIKQTDSSTSIVLEALVSVECDDGKRTVRMRNPYYRRLLTALNEALDETEGEADGSTISGLEATDIYADDIVEGVEKGKNRGAADFFTPSENGPSICKLCGEIRSMHNDDGTCAEPNR